MKNIFLYKKYDEIRNPTQNTKACSKMSFNDISSALRHLMIVHNYEFDTSDLSIRMYCYDCRVKCYVYVVQTDRYGDVDYLIRYGKPQFISYLVEQQPVIAMRDWR